MTEQRIRILNDTLINQIAAGEVIENPASVIKELVENAIDAGSTEIVVETQAAGRALIKVADNGCGMQQDDLVLSLERHATSKLTVIEELNSLRTLGFRGEALPSIASISKMTLHSATSNSCGTVVHVEGGKIGTIAPLPRRRGTTIEVRGLFFNVPVRRKFQKSLAWDSGEIHRTLTKFALCYPLVGFKWVNDEKHIISLPVKDSRQRRIALLLGEEMSASLLLAEHKSEQLHIEGKISLPAFSRPNRTGQYLFVNQRAVNSPLVAKKVVEGYGTRLSPNRYPLFVLYLELPPSWIDVNVHPQKKEIRIFDEEKLSHFIIAAIERSLQQTEQSAAPSILSFPALESSPLKLTVTEPALQVRPLPKEEPLLTTKPCIAGKVGNYLFLQESEGIRVVDCARAIERIVYEELDDKEGKVEIQTLLIPIQLSMKGKERALLEEYLPALNAHGISIRHFGHDSFIIDAIPCLLEPEELPDLIHAFLEEGRLPVKLGKSLKAKRNFTAMGEPLVEKLFRCKNTEQTPGGKKIHTLLDKNTLERLLDAPDRKSPTSACEI